MLAARTAPEQAVADALQLAAAGERITIKKAKELIDRYTVEAVVEAPSTPELLRESKAAPGDGPRTATELWAYSGDQVRVLIVSDRRKSLANVFVQNDVAEAYHKFQQACAEAAGHAGDPEAAQGA